MSALFLSTDTLDKPLEGYAAHRKTPPSTDSLTQRSYLTHNKTAAIPKRTAAGTVVRREAPNAPPGQTPPKTREAHHSPLSFNPRRPRTKGPDGFPSECIPQHEAPLSEAPKEQDKGASSARTHSEGNPSGPGESHRVIDYPVFCSPAETPVTVERSRLMYSAFFSSAISSWFMRTSRRARTWAMDRAST